MRLALALALALFVASPAWAKPTFIGTRMDVLWAPYTGSGTLLGYEVGLFSDDLPGVNGCTPNEANLLFSEAQPPTTTEALLDLRTFTLYGTMCIFMRPFVSEDPDAPWQLPLTPAQPEFERRFDADTDNDGIIGLVPDFQEFTSSFSSPCQPFNLQTGLGVWGWSSKLGCRPDEIGGQP